MTRQPYFNKRKTLPYPQCNHYQNPKEAAKLDNTLQEQVTTMHDTGDELIIHCPAFELFQTTIGIGTNP